MVFDTKRMSVVSDGEVNLKTEELHLSLEPSPKKGIGKLSLSLAESVKPFKLSLRSPKLLWPLTRFR